MVPSVIEIYWHVVKELMGACNSKSETTSTMRINVILICQGTRQMLKISRQHGENFCWKLISLYVNTINIALSNSSQN